MELILHHIIQSSICGLQIFFGSSMSFAFLLLLLRFRDLRTITNLLMSQVAVTNLLNLTVGASIFIDYEILELHQLENKLSASIFLFCERYFTLANSMVMALVVVDRFLAIRFDMKYTTGWRTKRRIICSIIFCWLSLLLLILLDLTINNPNLGKVPVWKYKLATSNTVYFDSVKAVFPVAFMILTILTWRSLKNRKNAVKRLGGRKNVVIESDEMKAARTIAIIAACYSCCTGLSILFQQLSKNELNKKRNHEFRWFYFLSQIFLTLPSSLNLFITWGRTKRLRRALKQLFNDPCGSSKLIEFQQHPPINLAPRPSINERKITRSSESIRKNDRGVARYLHHKNCGCSEEDITKVAESVLDCNSDTSYSHSKPNDSDTASVYTNERTEETIL